MEGMVESPSVEVYSVPCGLTWDADVALFVGEADMEGIVEMSTFCVYSGIGLPWGADVARADKEALVLWGISN